MPGSATSRIAASGRRFRAAATASPLVPASIASMLAFSSSVVMVDGGPELS
jgi:hypothetical protein